MIPLSILSKLLVAYLPAFIVKEIKSNYSVSSLLLRTSIFILLVASISFFVIYLKHTLQIYLNNSRLRRGSFLYNFMMTCDFEYLEKSNTYSTLNHAIDSFYDGPHEGFSNFIVDCLTLIESLLGIVVFGYTLFVIDYKTAVILLVISALSLIPNSSLEKWLRQNKPIWKKVETKLSYILMESIKISNAKDQRLYPMKKWFSDESDLLVNEKKNWAKKERNKRTISLYTVRILKAIKYLAAYFLVYKKVENGASVIEFVFLIGLILSFDTLVSGVFDNYKFLSSNNVTIDVTVDVIKNTGLVDDKGKILKEFSTDYNESDYTITKGIPHEITMENVSYKFPDIQEYIIEDLNLKINKGEKLALVGLNGAGKSTLVKLLCGLYIPTKGKILIDGVDISTLDKNYLFSLFSSLFQDFQIFAFTLWENISCTNKSLTDFERVNYSLKQAGLYEKVASLKDGINTNLLKEFDENGLVLSGGETQKLLLARAIYKDADIVILDEPTSALDAIAENELYQKYSEIMKNKTSIFISHRLSSTRFCDRVIVLDKGKIIQEGTHAQLAEEDGLYKTMYETQSSYFRSKEDN